MTHAYHDCLVLISYDMARAADLLPGPQRGDGEEVLGRLQARRPGSALLRHCVLPLQEHSSPLNHPHVCVVQLSRKIESRAHIYRAEAVRGAYISGPATSPAAYSALYL